MRFWDMGGCLFGGDTLSLGAWRGGGPIPAILRTAGHPAEVTQCAGTPRWTNSGGRRPSSRTGLDQRQGDDYFFTYCLLARASSIAITVMFGASPVCRPATWDVTFRGVDPGMWLHCPERFLVAGRHPTRQSCLSWWERPVEHLGRQPRWSTAARLIPAAANQLPCSYTGSTAGPWLKSSSATAVNPGRHATR